MNNEDAQCDPGNPQTYFNPAPTLDQIAAWVAIWNAIAEAIEPRETAAEARSWLDTIMTAEEAAEWLQMSKGKLLVAAGGRSPKIVGFWINERVVKFHPRTVLAKMAADARVPIDVIAASFGVPPDRNK